MNKVIIFGTEQLAQLAYYYLSKDTTYDVICFTVHKKYKHKDKFENKSVIDFEDIEHLYPPTEYMLFAPMSGKGLNKIRENVYNEGKGKGYKFISYISSKSTVLTDKIGDNCFILEDNTIQPFVEIGNNCVLWSGNHIGHHTIINDHVFITSHCVISGNCHIKPYSWLGVNCSIKNGIVIEEGTLIAMSASVIKPTDKYTIYMGIPAKSYGQSDDVKVSMSL